MVNARSRLGQRRAGGLGGELSARKEQAPLLGSSAVRGGGFGESGQKGAHRQSERLRTRPTQIPGLHRARVLPGQARSGSSGTGQAAQGLSAPVDRIALMELLIVHHDAELGRQLAQMVKDYSAHNCDLVHNDAAAVEWARRHSRCRLLLTQLEAEGIDGLVLGGTLSEIFLGLQTAFFPAYSAAKQRLQVAETKVFPEPIDGEGLLRAMARAENATADAPDLLPVVDVLQMCCLSRRGGAVQIVKGTQSGIVYLRDGQIVHGETLATQGQSALLEIVGWSSIEFAYDGAVRSPAETITLPWDAA